MTSTPSVRERSVFISHSSHDKRYVREIAGNLRRRGWTVWLDEEGIDGGAAWRASLIRALEESWIVILVVSRSSMTSKWVMREMDAADRLGLRIIPVVVDPVPYPDELRMLLSGVQQVDATGLFDDERRTAQLARIDDALVTAARSRLPGRPGTARIVAGTVIMTIGVIGIVVGFAAFVYLGQQSVSDRGSSTSPFVGWAVFAASMVVSMLGAGLRHWGRRSGI